jgi:hypothetical protein
LVLTSSVDALQACRSREQPVPWPLIWPSPQEVLLACPTAGTAASRPRESSRVPFSSWPFDQKSSRLCQLTQCLFRSPRQQTQRGIR